MKDLDIIQDNAILVGLANAGSFLYSKNYDIQIQVSDFSMFSVIFVTEVPIYSKLDTHFG
jgi:hypothetical protein